MRISTTLRSAATASAVGLALLLTGCGSSGDDSADLGGREDAAQEAGEDAAAEDTADADPAGLYTVDDLRAAVEAVDVDGQSLEIIDVDAADTSGVPAAEDIAIEPSECAAFYADSQVAAGSLGDTVIGILGVTGISAGGVVQASADSVEETMAASTEFITKCPEIAMEMPGTDGTVTTSVSESDVTVDGGVAYDMVMDMMGTEISLTTINVPVGNVIITVGGTSSSSDSFAEDAQSMVDQIREGLESSAS